MAAWTRILVVCTLALIVLPAAQAQTRRASGAWTVLCSEGAIGYCSASNRIKAIGGSPYRFQLNVSRGRPGADFEIALLTGSEHPGDGAAIAAQVDNRKALMLTSGEGYRRAGRSHTYVIAANETEGLLAQMRSGQRVVFRYEDAKGRPVAAAFSLGGMANALVFMDKMQPAPRSPATKVAATPPAKPAPVEEARPVPPIQEAKPAPAPRPTPIEAPAPGQTAEAAPIPAAAKQVAPAPRRKPAPVQKQAAVTAAPTLSRKRGAKSIRQFSCRGNEPFWTIVIDNDSARYSAPADAGQPDAVELKGKLSVTGDGPTPVIDWRGKSDWGGSFRAVITEQLCRDSMSDSEGQTQFEYRARVTLPGGKTVEGCCNAGLPPAEAATPTDTTQYPVADVRARPDTDWSRHLFELLPAIQACIDKTPEPHPYATKAWPMNHGMVGVRTRNRGGGWFECVAEGTGKSVDRFVPLPSTAPPAPNEDLVVFSPPDQSPPEGNCLKHERVMDGMGDFMGWLSTNACR
jgi:uncharacterized membrane protein